MTVTYPDGSPAKDTEQLHFYRAGSKELVYYVTPFSSATATSDNPNFFCGVDWVIGSDSAVVSVYITCTVDEGEGWVTLTFNAPDNQTQSIFIRVKKFEDFGFISADDKAKIDFLHARALILGTVQDNYDNGLWVAWEVPDEDIFINRKE